MEAFIRGVASVGLIAHAIYQFQHDANWWLYVPAYSLAAVVCFIPFPSNRVWRVLSAISVVGGGLMMLFLWWTLHTLDYTPSFRPSEGKNLLPIAIGVALSTTTRISFDAVEKPIHYIRSFILMSLLATSTTIIATSGQYYRF